MPTERSPRAARSASSSDPAWMTTRSPVGSANAAFVERFLAAERIPIVSKDVLDVHPRKVCFFPVSGRALVKKLPAASIDPALAEESRYRARIGQTQAAGSVELF